MFGPLLLPTKVRSKINISNELSCMICERNFSLTEQRETYFDHLLKCHKVVIHDVENIINLSRYSNYWKEKFRTEDINTFFEANRNYLENIKRSECNSETNYYHFCDLLPEDKKLRYSLKIQHLEEALDQQKLEREDDKYSKGCLFCRSVIGSTRASYINHLASQHNLYLGKPENLVYIDKMLSIVEEKLQKLQCIFCEKIFKCRNTLKEHMRKKQHKCINPKNELFDQFFIINYIKSTGPSKCTGNDDDPEDEICDWSDWKEECEVNLVCLFCTKITTSWQEVNLHMIEDHNFSYEDNTINMNFYEQVKFVNYVRRQIYRNRCIICDNSEENISNLLEHMKNEQHLTMPSKTLWNHPEFYFPTYENDAFLCHLDDKTEDDDVEHESSLNLSDSYT